MSVLIVLVGCFTGLPPLVCVGLLILLWLERP